MSRPRDSGDSLNVSLMSRDRVQIYSIAVSCWDKETETNCKVSLSPCLRVAQN